MPLERACITDIGLSEESLAFVLYVLRVTDEIPLDIEEIIFTKCNEKFGVATAVWATAFANGNTTIEYWVIHRYKKATALATRYTNKNGERGYAFTQLIMHPIDAAGVQKLIQSMPSVLSYLSSDKLH